MIEMLLNSICFWIRYILMLILIDNLPAILVTSPLKYTLIDFALSSHSILTVQTDSKRYCKLVVYFCLSFCKTVQNHNFQKQNSLEENKITKAEIMVLFYANLLLQKLKEHFLKFLLRQHFLCWLEPCVDLYFQKSLTNFLKYTSIKETFSRCPGWTSCTSIT